MIDFSVGYTFYNREDMVVPVLEGIARCFSNDCEVILHFDACTDRSLQTFKKNCSILGKREVKVLKTKRDLFELKSNNLHIDTFTRDVLAIFQDDMVCVDPYLCGRVERVMDEYGERLGLLGARDGYEVEGGERVDFARNEWSSTQEGVLIGMGEWFEHTFINRGPIFLTRNLLEKVPCFNEDFYPGSFDDRDFCCRAKFLHGLSNVVMYSRIREVRTYKTTILDEFLLQTLNAKKFYDKWRRYVGCPQNGVLDESLRGTLNLLSRSHAIRRELMKKRRFGLPWLWHSFFNGK